MTESIPSVQIKVRKINYFRYFLARATKLNNSSRLRIDCAQVTSQCIASFCRDIRRGLTGL